MKLEVLLHFLEQDLDTPSLLVKECNLFGLYIKVVRQKIIITVPFILITDLP